MIGHVVFRNLKRFACPGGCPVELSTRDGTSRPFQLICQVNPMVGRQASKFVYCYVTDLGEQKAEDGDESFMSLRAPNARKGRGANRQGTPWLAIRQVMTNL